MRDLPDEKVREVFCVFGLKCRRTATCCRAIPTGCAWAALLSKFFEGMLISDKLCSKKLGDLVDFFQQICYSLSLDGGLYLACVARKSRMDCALAYAQTDHRHGRRFCGGKETQKTTHYKALHATDRSLFWAEQGRRGSTRPVTRHG